MRKLSKSTPDIDRSYLLAIIDSKISVIERFGALGRRNGDCIDQFWGQALPHQHAGSVTGLDRIRSQRPENDTSISHGPVIKQTQRNRDPQDREVKRSPATQFQIDATPPVGRRQNDFAQYFISRLCVRCNAIIAKKFLHRHKAFTASTDEAHLRSEAYQHRRGIGGGDRPAAWTSRGDQADLSVLFHAVADGVSPEFSLVVVVTAGIQEQIPANRANVAQLDR